MYSESLTHNFVIEGDAATRFWEALEESMNEPKEEIDVQFEELHGMDEIRKFMARRTIKKVEK